MLYNSLSKFIIDACISLRVLGGNILAYSILLAIFMEPIIVEKGTGPNSTTSNAQSLKNTLFLKVCTYIDFCIKQYTEPCFVSLETVVQIQSRI